MLFFFKQKTAYEMRISDWSSDVCSSDLSDAAKLGYACGALARRAWRGFEPVCAIGGDAGSRTRGAGFAGRIWFRLAACNKLGLGDRYHWRPSCFGVPALEYRTARFDVTRNFRLTITRTTPPSRVRT